MRQNKEGVCGREFINISATWCNESGRTLNVKSDSKIKIAGPAIGSMNNGNPIVHYIPVSSLGDRKCKTASWRLQINNCEAFFFYEVDIKTTEKKCGGYFFARQMKAICDVHGDITCSLADGTPCEDYDGPIIKTIEEAGCKTIKCIDGETPKSCRQSIDYKFTINNKVDQSVKFDLSPPQLANSKVAWEIVEPNDQNFLPLYRNSKVSWILRKSNVNVCRVIPSASMNVRGNIVDADKKNDQNYQFCYDYAVQLKRKFDNGKKLPFCLDISPGTSILTCPRITPGSPSDSNS